MMSGLAILTVLVAIVAIGIVLNAVKFIVNRRGDPALAARWTAGTCLLIVGALVLALGLAYVLGALSEGDALILEEHVGPNSSNSVSLHVTGDLVGPLGLSIWLLVAGAAIGLGLYLRTRRISLLSLVIASGLLALLGSLPHLLIQQPGRKAVISVVTDRALSEAEYAHLERVLSKEGLCLAVSEPVQKRLSMPVAAALTSVELARSTEAGVRLTLRFSHQLEREELEILFHNLAEYVKKVLAAK